LRSLARCKSPRAPASSTLDSEQEYLDAEQALIVAQRAALLDNYRLLSNMGRLVPEMVFNN